jgi:hypothetical protein
VLREYALKYVLTPPPAQVIGNAHGRYCLPSWHPRIETELRRKFVVLDEASRATELDLYIILA